MSANPLMDWCEQVASPVLHAAAAGQPISYAAREALLRLSEILTSLSPGESHLPSEKQTSPGTSE